MDGRRVVHDDAGLLFATFAAQPDAAQTQTAASFDCVAEIRVEPTVDERIVAHGRHGQPVADEESGRIVAAGRFGRADVAHQMVDVERQPAKSEQ